MEISNGGQGRAKQSSSVPTLSKGYRNSNASTTGRGSQPQVIDFIDPDVRQYRVRIQVDGNGADLDSPNLEGLDSSGRGDTGDRDPSAVQVSPCCVTPAGCSGDSRSVPANLNYMQRIVIGSGHILNDLCASLWFSYLLLYLEKVVGFSSTNSAALLLLGQVREIC